MNMYRVACFIHGMWIDQGTVLAPCKSNACHKKGLEPKGMAAGRIRVRLAEPKKKKR